MDDPLPDNTLTGVGTLLDPQIGSDQGTVNVVPGPSSVVPEPSSLVVFAGLALLARPYIWRRRRRQCSD